MRLLRQSTPTLVHIGPFVASADNVSPQTALAFSAGQINMLSAGAGLGADISGRVISHIENGIYGISLIGSDLGTLGPIEIHARGTGCLPVLWVGNVLAQGAYDTLCGGGNMPSNTLMLNGSQQAAQNLASGALTAVNVVIGNGSSTTLIATNLTSVVGGFYNGRTLVFETGALAGQATTITGYNGATKQLTVAALTSAPVPGDAAIIV